MKNPNTIPEIFDHAAFKARRLGLMVTDAAVANWVERLETDSTLFRHRVSAMAENVPMVIDGKEVVIQWWPDRRVIHEVFPPHPKGVITPGCLNFLLTIGFNLTQDDVKRMIRGVEAPTTKRVLLDTGLIQAAIDLDVTGDKMDVLYDPRVRRIMKVTPHVLRYATDHAIKRAKQRYHLPLTSDTAREMVEMMKAGKYVRNKPGPTQQKDTIRATLHYDCEDFTIVYDPRVHKIVTVTPLGDFDYRRKLRGE